MTIVVEDGSGVASAEAYCTVAFATDYHAKRGNAVWATLTSDQQEQALRRACDYMTQTYRLRWMGSRTGGIQALDWPRVGVNVADLVYFYPWGEFSWGANVAYNVVPGAVQIANAVFALKSLDDSGAIVDLAPDIGRLTKSEKVGDLAVEYESGAAPWTQYRAIDLLLQPYLLGSGQAAVLRR